MDARDLDDIEGALELRLPTAYRSLMLAYPFGPESQAAELWLPADPDAVVGDTDRARRSFALQGQPWPRDFIIVGGDGGEALYVLDLSREPAPVLAFELETGNTRPLAPNVTAFAELLRAREAEIDADERAMEHRELTKPQRRGEHSWWHFWR